MKQCCEIVNYKNVNAYVYCSFVKPIAKLKPNILRGLVETHFSFTSINTIAPEIVSNTSYRTPLPITNPEV